jgi:predicted small integral membrane protein
MPDERTQDLGPTLPALLPGSEDNSVPQISPRQGFLPFATNAWDRIFISALCLVAIHLLWLRFVEAAIPIYGAMVVSLALAYYIVKRG